MELLQGTAAEISFEPELPDDAELDSAAITVIRDSTGETIVDGETADVTDGVISYALAADDTAEVELFHVTVDAQVDSADATFAFEVEVVGNFVASVAAIVKGLSTTPDTSDVIMWREVATRAIEDACGFALRPRYAKEVLDGSGTKGLLLSHPHVLRVLSASIGGVSQDTSGYTLREAGGVVRSATDWAAGDANVEIVYAHGRTSFPPAVLPVADLTRHFLLEDPSLCDQRATSITTEDGTYSLVTAGMRGSLFPLPSVNAFVQQYGMVAVA